MENISKFYQKLMSDKDMQERGKGKIATLDTQERNEENAMNALIAFAKEEGFEFSAEMFKAYHTEKQQLTDDELENVVGGKCDNGNQNDTTTCACVIGGGGTQNGITQWCSGLGLGCFHTGECKKTTWSLQCFAGGVTFPCK